MNNITALQADKAALEARIASLEAGLSNLRDYMQSSKFRRNPDQWDATDTMVQAVDIVHIVDAIRSNAQDAENASFYNEVGPKPEPSDQGWRCRECHAPLEQVWNDTDSKAAERMRQHWVATHRQVEVTA